MSELESYLRPRARMHAKTWFLSLLLLSGGIALALYAYAELKRLDELLLRNSVLSAALAVKPAPGPRPADLELRKRWALLAAERDFPWQRVFSAVERADRDTIELLEFIPDKHTQVLILRGEARNAEALTGYLEALGSDLTLSQVHLVSRKNVTRNALTTVGFELKARVLN